MGLQVSNLCLFTVFMTLKTFSKYFQNALIEFVQNFATTEASRGCTSSLQRFLKKKNSLYREIQASKKRNVVIMLPW